MNYKIAKLKYSVINLSETIADSIVTYCLGQMKNSEFDYSNWEIGTSSMLKQFKEGQGKCWKCHTKQEAQDTKKYFIEDKIMTDADEKNTKGKFIYVRTQPC